MFQIPVQAAIGGKIIARETIRALRKGRYGQVLRRRRLPQAQAAGEAEGRQEEDAAIRQGRDSAGSLHRSLEDGRLMRQFRRGIGRLDAAPARKVDCRMKFAGVFALLGLGFLFDQSRPGQAAPATPAAQGRAELRRLHGGVHQGRPCPIAPRFERARSPSRAASSATRPASRCGCCRPATDVDGTLKCRGDDFMPVRGAGSPPPVGDRLARPISKAFRRRPAWARRRLRLGPPVRRATSRRGHGQRCRRISACL